MGVLTIILALILVGMFYHNQGFKKGLKECERNFLNEGYKNGIKQIEDEIKELATLPDEEILKRIKNFCKK